MRNDMAKLGELNAVLEVKIDNIINAVKATDPQNPFSDTTLEELQNSITKNREVNEEVIEKLIKRLTECKIQCNDEVIEKLRNFVKNELPKMVDEKNKELDEKFIKQLFDKIDKMSPGNDIGFEYIKGGVFIGSCVLSFIAGFSIAMYSLIQMLPK